MFGNKRYYIAKTVYFGSFVVAAYCVTQILKAGYTNLGEAKFWFIALGAATLTGTVSGVAYYYCRSQPDLLNQRTKISVETLAATQHVQEKSRGNENSANNKR